MDLTHIDAHTHLNFDAFGEDRSDTINEMENRGIGAVNVGIDKTTSEESVKLAETHNHIWASVGCHPTEASASFQLEEYKSIIEDTNQAKAVGECGLDYSRKKYRSEEKKQLQEEIFELQIQLAIKKDLPLILHLRPRENSMDAYEDGLDILEHYAHSYDDDLRGTAHFFVGTKEIAHRFLDIGFYVSFTGPVTFEDRLQKVCTDIPKDRLIAETDTPFAAPDPHRGKRNSPLFLPDIVSVVAGCKDMQEDKLAEGLVANTRRLFNL